MRFCAERGLDVLLMLSTNAEHEKHVGLFFPELALVGAGVGSPGSPASPLDFCSHDFYVFPSSKHDSRFSKSYYRFTLETSRV